MAQIHRFHDKVAVWLGTGETVYMTWEEAKALSRQLRKCALSVQNESFQDSTYKTFNIELSGERD